jgi:hypothetical protein
MPGSTLLGSTTTFQWDAGVGVSEYLLYVGTAVGSNDIYGAGLGTSRSVVVGGIPTDESIIYVRLWSRIGGDRRYRDYTYRAATQASGTTEISPFSCDREISLRSIDGATSVIVTFINRAVRPRKLYWLSYSGARVLYYTLKPNESIVQHLSQSSVGCDRFR